MGCFKKYFYPTWTLTLNSLPCAMGTRRQYNEHFPHIMYPSTFTGEKYMFPYSPSLVSERNQQNTPGFGLF